MSRKWRRGLRPILRGTDRNHAELFDRAATLGFATADTHAIGKGFPDGVWSRGGVTWLIEIKPGDEIESKRALSDPEMRFALAWRDPDRHVVVGCTACVLALARGERCAACGVSGPVRAIDYADRYPKQRAALALAGLR